MDPDRNLARQLELAKKIIEALEEGRPVPSGLPRVAEATEELASLVEALDGWVAGGGFYPKRWRDAQDGFLPVGVKRPTNNKRGK